MLYKQMSETRKAQKHYRKNMKIDTELMKWVTTSLDVVNADKKCGFVPSLPLDLRTRNEIVISVLENTLISNNLSKDFIDSVISHEVVKDVLLNGNSVNMMAHRNSVCVRILHRCMSDSSVNRMMEILPLLKSTLNKDFEIDELSMQQMFKFGQELWTIILKNKSTENMLGWIKLLNGFDIKLPSERKSMTNAISKVSAVLHAVQSGVGIDGIKYVLGEMKKWNKTHDWQAEIVELASLGRVDVIQLLWEKNPSWFTSNPSAMFSNINLNGSINEKGAEHYKRFYKFEPIIGSRHRSSPSVIPQEVVAWVVKTLCPHKKLHGMIKALTSKIETLEDSESFRIDGWPAAYAKVRNSNYKNLLMEMEKQNLAHSFSDPGPLSDRGIKNKVAL